jgi:hypothetical protein
VFPERLGRRKALWFADELDRHWRPQVGAPWLPRTLPGEVMTAGQNKPRYRAGALHRRPGQVQHGLWLRQRTKLFLDLLNLLDQADPARRLDRLSVVADNGKIHKAAALRHWLRPHPRVYPVVSTHVLSPCPSPRALLRRRARQSHAPGANAGAIWSPMGQSISPRMGRGSIS